MAPPSRTTSDAGRSVTSCGSWTDETPTVKVTWKRTGARRLPPTARKSGDATPHSATGTPAGEASIAHRRASGSVSDEEGANWSDSAGPTISRQDSIFASEVAWREHHRLRYTPPLPPVGSTLAPRSCVRVRVELLFTANGKVVAAGTANLAVQPDPIQPDHNRLHDVSLHRVPKRRGSKARVLGARIAVARVRSVHESMLPFEKTVFFVRHGQSEYNRAEQELNVIKMVGSVDHPLSSRGTLESHSVRFCSAPFP